MNEYSYVIDVNPEIIWRHIELKKSLDSLIPYKVRKAEERINESLDKELVEGETYTEVKCKHISKVVAVTNYGRLYNLKTRRFFKNNWLRKEHTLKYYISDKDCFKLSENAPHVDINLTICKHKEHNWPIWLLNDSTHNIITEVYEQIK